MEHIKLLRAILPDVLIDNFDVVNFEKGDTRFDIWLDEKKVLMREDKVNCLGHLAWLRRVPYYPRLSHPRSLHIPACTQAQVARQRHGRDIQL